jgi:hypothetical protein
MKQEELRQPRTRIEADYSPTVRIGGGEHFFPLLTLATVEDKHHYFIQHTERSMPDGRSLIQSDATKTEDFSSKKIHYSTYFTILRALIAHEEVKGYHINTFSFILGFCQSHGVDLYKLGLVEL